MSYNKVKFIKQRSRNENFHHGRGGAHKNSLEKRQQKPSTRDYLEEAEQELQGSIVNCENCSNKFDLETQQCPECQAWNCKAYKPWIHGHQPACEQCKHANKCPWKE